MIETHPFGYFCPKNARFLILGSFVTKRDSNGLPDWFYGSKRNQFWKILEKVYDTGLNNIEEKKKLLSEKRIAITDVIYKCERRHKNSSDSNLRSIVYNTKTISKILKRNKIEKIFFTSQFAERNFKNNFKDLIAKYPKIELSTLPSPSPRLAWIGMNKKIKLYKNILPRK